VTSGTLALGGCAKLRTAGAGCGSRATEEPNRFTYASSGENRGGGSGSAAFAGTAVFAGNAVFAGRCCGLGRHSLPSLPYLVAAVAEQLEVVERVGPAGGSRLLKSSLTS